MEIYSVATVAGNVMTKETEGGVIKNFKISKIYRQGQIIKDQIISDIEQLEKSYKVKRFKQKDGYVICGQCESKIGCNNICGDCFCQYCLKFNDECNCS